MPDPVALDSDGNDAAMWHALLDIADRQPGEWTIVGALMVALHCAESGVPRLRATRDLDAVVEVRGVAGGTARFAELLATLGWDIADEDVGGDGIGHRFTKGRLKFDLLAPEGIGGADLTTRKPLKTVEIPGGTRALRRTSHVPVTVRGRTGTLPGPDLLGALVVKSCAAVADRGSDGKDPRRHVDDLAHLYARVPNPRQVAAAATARDRRRLRAAPEPEWDVVGDAAMAANGRAARTLVLRA